MRSIASHRNMCVMKNNRLERYHSVAVFFTRTMAIIGRRTALIAIGNRFSRPISRCGITVTEVLVVIGVIGVLAALLLPAVQSSRATGRHVVCRSNLHQIAIAVRNFEARTGSLSLNSPLTTLLPDMDNRVLLEQLQKQTTLNQLLSKRTQFPAYNCPDRATTLPLQIDYLANGELGRFGYQFKDVTDGLSQTAFFSEQVLQFDDPYAMNFASEEEMDLSSQAVPLRWTWHISGPIQSSDQFIAMCDDASQHRGIHPFGVITSFRNLMQGNSSDQEKKYNHRSRPNGFCCHNVDPTDPDAPTSWVVYPPNYRGPLFFWGIAPSSTHPGDGVNVMMGDGSVHFITKLIDGHVWQALGTPNGRDRAGEF